MNNDYLRPRLFRGAIREIILANGLVFGMMILFQAQLFFSRFFGLVPRFVTERLFIWQLLTYMFVHGGIGHLFWNMLILWMFGMELEHYWGKREFYRYYLITGVGAGVLTLLCSWNSTIPVIGASGAIYGVLVAFAMMFPNRLIYFYFIIPIRAKYFVLVMGVITFFSSFTQGSSQISHLTHLGGILFGLIYLRRQQLGRMLRLQLPRWHIRNPFRHLIRRRPQGRPGRPFQHDTDQTLRDELDRILDKIDREGYDRLDANEKRTLYLASEYFSSHSRHKN